MKSSELQRIVNKWGLNTRIVPLDGFQLNIDSNFIINSDPSHLPGRHWFAVFNTSPVEFFDPLGKDANYYGLEDKLPINFIYNKTRVQGPTSILCGQFCIYYIFLRSSGLSMLEIVNILSSDYVMNDKIVCSFVNKL